MKEAIMLLLVLLIGVFTSQSFGYNASPRDTKLLNAVYTQVDYLKLTDADKLEEIYVKLTPVMDRFADKPHESFLLARIYSYVDRAINPMPAHQVASTNGYSNGLIEALGEMFE